MARGLWYHLSSTFSNESIRRSSPERVAHISQKLTILIPSFNTSLNLLFSTYKTVFLTGKFDMLHRSGSMSILPVFRSL